MTSRKALQERIGRLARRHGHIVYQEGQIMVVTGDSTAFLLCLGDDDADLSRERQQQVVRWLQRAQGRVHARVIWPKDWPEVRQLIVSGDWRN
jgi:hypothetical protein